MGCRHYFDADRLEDLVDKGDSRSSSRVREHGNFRLVSQLHMAIQTTVKSMSTSSSWVDCCPPTGRSVLTRSASTFSSVSLSLSEVRNVCRFPEHSNGTFVLFQQVALFCELDLGLVGLVGSFLLVQQLLNPIPSSNDLSRKSSDAV